MNDKKRKQKAYYKKCAKKSRVTSGLHCGLKGFLLTCNNRERECVNEAYGLLNAYADSAYGTEFPSQDVEGGAEGASAGEEDEDFDAALKRETEEIKTVQKKPRRFQQVRSGAQNCVFIMTTMEDPCALCDDVISGIVATGQMKSRFIIRLQPVVATCHANMESIKSCLTSELVGLLGADQPGVSYKVEAKVRNNNDLTVNALKLTCGREIALMNDKNAVCFENPDYVIQLDVIKNTCCVSLMKDYYKLSKYNLQTLGDAVGEAKSGEQTSKSETTEDSAVKKLENTEDSAAKKLENTEDSAVKKLENTEETTTKEEPVDAEVSTQNTAERGVTGQAKESVDAALDSGKGLDEETKVESVQSKDDESKVMGNA